MIAFRLSFLLLFGFPFHPAASFQAYQQRENPFGFRSHPTNGASGLPKATVPTRATTDIALKPVYEHLQIELFGGKYIPSNLFFLNSIVDVLPFAHDLGKLFSLASSTPAEEKESTNDLMSHVLVSLVGFWFYWACSDNLLFFVGHRACPDNLLFFFVGFFAATFLSATATFLSAICKNPPNVEDHGSNTTKNLLAQKPMLHAARQDISHTIVPKDNIFSSASSTSAEEKELANNFVYYLSFALVGVWLACFENFLFLFMGFTVAAFLFAMFEDPPNVEEHGSNTTKNLLARKTMLHAARQDISQTILPKDLMLILDKTRISGLLVFTHTSKLPLTCSPEEKESITDVVLGFLGCCCSACVLIVLFAAVFDIFVLYDNFNHTTHILIAAFFFGITAAYCDCKQNRVET